MTDQEVDAFVGRALAARRRELGWSQKQLAPLLGVSFQQLAKYETAENRTSASKLWRAARILGVPVESFFPSTFA